MCPNDIISTFENYNITYENTSNMQKQVNTTKISIKLYPFTQQVLKTHFGLAQMDLESLVPTCNYPSYYKYDVGPI